VSKNPPLTEDQIRQSAEAEARHAATQASRHAQLDYMITHAFAADPGSKRMLSILVSDVAIFASCRPLSASRCG